MERRFGEGAVLWDVWWVLLGVWWVLLGVWWVLLLQLEKLCNGS